MSVENRVKLNRIDYSDLYTVNFTSKNSISKEDFLKSLFSSMPKWAKKAMKIDKQIALAAGGNNANITPGGKFLFFDIISVGEYEIILGGNENVMSYRLAIAFINNIDDKYIGVVSTKVLLKNFSGKIYFFFVKPFHKMLMKKICAGAESSLSGV